MNHTVKEMFNAIYSDEEKAKKLNIRRSSLGRRTVGIKVIQYHYFDVSPITDFTHFINCEVSPLICPMQWEDLEVDLSSKDKRHCEHCDKFVYKVDNEFMVNKMQDEDKCMAISNTLLEKMNGKMDEERHKNIQDRLSLSMLFLIYKKLNQKEFKEFLDNDFTQEMILKGILLDILNSSNIKQTIEWYRDNGVDLEIIFHQVLANIDDDKFIIRIEEKMEKFIKMGVV